MSVLKLTKNDIVRNGDNGEKIKLKRSDLSYDSAKVSGWEQANRQSLDILNDYNNRINKSEWLDEEDRKKYRSALDSYIETSNYLRGINKTFGEGYSDEDEKKWSDSIAYMNEAYDSTDKYYSQWIDEKDYKGQRDGWFQKSNLFDDGWQWGDVTKTVVGSLTDLGENLGAGIVGIGEKALDALVTIAPYVAQGQYYANGGGYNLQADQAFDQSIQASKEANSEFVKKDLYDEEAIAKTIIAEPVKALTGINAETDSVFGEKSDGLAQSAGQLGGTAALQMVGVPWWLTTGVTTFGSESENAFNQGATYEEAALSGLISAGAEILTEKIGGISFGGKTLNDVLTKKLASGISNKIVKSIVKYGGGFIGDIVGEGLEESITEDIGAFGRWLTYQDDKTLRELLFSEEAMQAKTDAFIGGAVLGGFGNVSGNARQKIYANKQAAKIYGNQSQVLVDEALGSLFSDVRAVGQKYKDKLDSGKKLSGGDLNRLVDVTDKSKLKSSVLKRLGDLGETSDVTAVADVLIRQAMGEELSSKDVQILNDSKAGHIVSAEMNEVNIKSGGLANKWAEKIGTRRINPDVYNREANALAKKREASKDAKITVKKDGAKVEVKPNKITSLENDTMSIELDNGEVVNADEVDFGESDIGLVYQVAKDMASRVSGFTLETANALVTGYNPTSGQTVGEYVNGWNNAFRLGKTGVPSSKLVGVINSGISERVAFTAYELGRQSAEKGESDLKSLSNNGIINTNKSEVANESGESIRLRNSSKRDGGKNTQRQVSRMESSTGQTESRGKTAQIADSEATRLVNEGREVKVADLGILGGSKEQTVRLVDKANETTSMKEARKRAEVRGLKVTFFVGDNLVIEDKTGEWISARAYIKGNHVFVRADHSLYTADQLMRHELGHDMIAKGEVDIKAVRKRLEETVGKENIDEVAKHYADAYEGTGMSAEEIWEECICDSLGDMNIFAGKEQVGAFLDQMLPEISAVASESKSPTQTRGSPDGKASRETYSKRDKALYASGVSFLHKNFPPENESLSEAHRLAVLWARNQNTETGDQTLIFMNDVCYLVECFDDALNYYQVEDVVSKAEFDIIYKEIKQYGRSGQIKSVQGSTDFIDKLYKSNGFAKTRKPSANSNETRHGTEDSKVQRVGEISSSGRERASSNRSRDSQSSSEDRQKYSRELDTNSTEYKINTSMTMAEAKRMIETAFKVNGIAEYYEGEYKDAEDWLNKAGSDEVEMYIENDFDLQAKYINSNEDILNEEYRISDVLDAYLAGTLIGKEKPKPKRLDVSQSTKLEDSRFYSPQKIEDAKATFELAKQKAVGKDANAINRARAEILLFAHNKGAAELLGVTQAELNKKLRSWSNYSATAKNISERINAGVAEENRWTGIENSSYINKAKVTNEDIERLVASVEGDSKGYERKYIARVMLAADTHIDYSGLKFKFASSQQVNADNNSGGNSGGRVLGFYDDTNRQIEVTHDKPNTVAHEMGHYIDAQWGRELVGSSSSHLFLSRGVNADIVRERYGEPGVQFLNNFKLFINSLSDVNQTYDSYYNNRGEVFARFFARFIEWTDNIATGNKYYSYESTMYGDKFTQAQYVEFARLLQEKALLDGTIKENNQHGKASRELDDEYSRIYSMKSEVNQLREGIRKIEASDDFKAQMDKFSEAVAKDDVVNGVKAYEEWKKASGYGELVSKRDALLNDIGKLTEEYEKKRESREVEKEKAAIAKSGLSEADYFRMQAVKEFGYTPHFYDAGYILPNGKMLNFSGEKNHHFGSRGQDHRAIGIIYANTQGSAALVRFMNDGNIRIMAESPGLDISSNLEPTREQYSIIRSFIYEYANQEYFNIDLADEGGRVIGSLEYEGRINPTRIINDIKHYYETGEIRAQSNVDKFRYSRELDTERVSYAPTFYSHMGKVIDGIKLEKMGAGGVVSYLKGRGVKDEEIKWSGIETFLEGKKSVTKAELQEFVAGSQLQIEEVFRLDASNIGVEVKELSSKTKALYIDGEMVETFNQDSFGEWHPEKEPQAVFMDDEDILKRYSKTYYEKGAKWTQYKLDGGSNYRELVFTMPNATYTNRAMRGHWGQDAEGILVHTRIQDFTVDGKKMLFIEELQSDWHNEGHSKGYVSKLSPSEELKLQKLREEKKRLFEEMRRIAKEDGPSDEFDRIYDQEHNIGQEIESMVGTDNSIPDAPFRSTYHEYVLKRLLRMAAEEGYDSIGWTIADTQSKRWSYDYEKAYQIEYDQEMPKFLRKYGKKWGATVGKSSIYNTEIWSMDITDSMKESVLYEGQPKFSRELDFIDYIEESKPLSNREILANALETTAQHDVEREKLKQYKSKIDLINSEQEKLQKLQEQISELYRKKGKRDTEAIKNLQFEANQAANRINTYDKQLLDLESTKALKGVLLREKAMLSKRLLQKATQSRKEALDKARERAAKTQRELMNRYQESRKRGIESRNKTAMRHKIKDVVNELNQYLLKGTKDKHVPIELQKPVAEALNAVNMDTVSAEERITKKRAEMMSAKTPEAIEKLAKEIEHIQEMGGNMEAKLSRLKTAYDSIINSDDPLVANSHDEVISNTIGKVIEDVGETPLRDMSLYQLEAVYDMYRMVLHSIRNANKAFKAKKSEEISVIANRVMEEVDKLGKRRTYQSKASDAISAFDWNNEKPVYAFERIGSDTFTEVYNNVRAGEDTWAVDMSEAQAFREEQYNKYKYDSWDFDKKYTFTSSTGKSFELTLGQIMSLYAFSKRGKQAKDHLKNGGFVFDGLTEVKQKNKLGVTVTYQLKDATAYNLSEEILTDIISKLKPEQTAFVDAMQDYLTAVMGEKGNEVSLELYGVKLFSKEKHYFPLKSAPQFLERAREQAQGDVKIKNKGFTKETTPKAKNPIVLTSFMDVWAGHVNEMAMYHSFTLALEDFYRVFNYKTPASETMDSEGVISFLENAHGAAAVSYIDQLLKDLNGGARSDPRENSGKALMSRFKKSAVIASLSVVVQQPTSIIRAMALVDAKYFGVAPISRGVLRTINRKKHKALWAEVKKYAPIAIIKEMGYFDTGTGKSSVEWLKGEKTFMDKVDDALSKAPAVADELAWISIWEAVKRETAHNHPKLNTNSEEFLKLAGERFTEVVTKTQVYDSTLAKSANMRSKGALMNMWTAFMAEPTTAINMVANALRKGDKRYAARVLGSVIGSVALNAALVSLVYAMRDDDEDETFAEKYLSRVTTEFVDGINPVTYIPFVKDIWSVMQGFDVERADMSLITEMVDSLQQIVKVISVDTSSMSEEKLDEHMGKVSEALWSIVDNISSLVGIPVKNIRRDINGIINLFKTLGRDNETTFGSLMDKIGDDLKDSVPVWGWLPDESKADKLYDAIVSGDTAYVERLKSGYKDESTYNSAIRKALRENDSRIKEAAEAFLNGDYATYNKLREEIVAEGIFSRQIVTDALKAEYNYLKNKAK